MVFKKNMTLIRIFVLQFLKPTHHKQLHQIKHFELHLFFHTMSNNPTISKTSYVVCFYSLSKLNYNIHINMYMLK